mgnify:CR=1 FL=1
MSNLFAEELENTAITRIRAIKVLRKEVKNEKD